MAAVLIVVTEAVLAVDLEALKILSIIGALFMIAGYGRVSRAVEPAYEV